MPKYYRHYLDQVNSPPDVPMGPLKGGQVARSHRVHAVLNGLDKVPACGRRVLLAQSMSGSGRYIVADTLTPASTLARVIARGRADLTPGSFLGMSVLYLPGGDTSDVGPFGQLQLDVTWTDRDGGSVSTTHTLNLEANPGGGVPTELFSAFKLKRSGVLKPGSLVGITTCRLWSRFTHVEMTLSVRGSSRIVDAVVYERPHSIALEADDAADYWVSGMFAAHRPGGNVPNLQYPMQRLSETGSDGDPRGGTWMLMDQVRAQANHLGPMLFSWTGHIEESDGTSAEDGYLTATAGTSVWTRVPDRATGAALTLSAADQPGWGMASGGYARPVGENPAASMGNAASIPVRIYARLSSDDAAFLETFVLRIYTAPYSYIELSGTAPDPSSPAWFTAYGHLRCGQGPGDPAKATAVIRRSGGVGDLRVYDLACYRAMGLAVAS